MATTTINRLSQRDIGALIDAVIGNKPLLPSIRQDIIERTDGIPLFVEEMTKAILEAESEGVAKRAASAIPSSGRAVPGTLQASLLAHRQTWGGQGGSAGRGGHWTRIFLRVGFCGRTKAGSGVG